MSAKNSRETNGIVFRNPKTEDGKYFWEIAKASKILDVNSTYHYLIMCRHFKKTCIAAEKQGRVIGFVIAYIPPDSPDTVFVWQVAVDAKERGQGLGVRMLVNVFKNVKPFDVKNLDATITPSNKASIGLFTAAARELNAPFMLEDDFFSTDDFGQNAHEAEMLFHIGPISD
ncbi:MAG: diaminobutyrate acetyltransferase [Desulfobacterales bacterium]|nr:diaminobutyrate acetyltransferase [Desulfobacterales bacterium]